MSTTKRKPHQIGYRADLDENKASEPMLECLQCERVKRLIKQFNRRKLIVQEKGYMMDVNAVFNTMLKIINEED